MACPPVRCPVDVSAELARRNVVPKPLPSNDPLDDEKDDTNGLFSEPECSAKQPDQEQPLENPLPLANEKAAEADDLHTEPPSSATKPGQQEPFDSSPPFGNEDDSQVEDVHAVSRGQQQPLPAGSRASLQKSHGGSSDTRFANLTNQPSIAPTKAAVPSPRVEQAVAPEDPEPPVAQVSPRRGLKERQSRLKFSVDAPVDGPSEKNTSAKRGTKKSKGKDKAEDVDEHLEGNARPDWQSDAMVLPIHHQSPLPAAASSSSDEVVNGPGPSTAYQARFRLRPSQGKKNKRYTIPSFIEYESAGSGSQALDVSTHAGARRGSKRLREDIEDLEGPNGEEEHINYTSGEACFESTVQESMAPASQYKRRKAQGNNNQSSSTPEPLTLPSTSNGPANPGRGGLVPQHPGRSKFLEFVNDCYLSCPGPLKFDPESANFFVFDSIGHPRFIPTAGVAHEVISLFTQVAGGTRADLPPSIWAINPVTGREQLVLPLPPSTSLLDEFLAMVGAPEAPAVNDSQNISIPSPLIERACIPNTLPQPDRRGPRIPEVQQPQLIARPVIQESYMSARHPSDYQNGTQSYTPAAVNQGHQNDYHPPSSNRSDNQAYTPAAFNPAQQNLHPSSSQHQNNNAPVASQPHVNVNQGTHRPNHPTNMQLNRYNAVSGAPTPTLMQQSARMPSTPTLNETAHAEVPPMGHFPNNHAQPSHLNQLARSSNAQSFPNKEAFNWDVYRTRPIDPQTPAVDDSQPSTNTEVAYTPRVPGGSRYPPQPEAPPVTGPPQASSSRLGTGVPTTSHALPEVLTDEFAQVPGENSQLPPTAITIPAHIPDAPTDTDYDSPAWDRYFALVCAL